MVIVGIIETFRVATVIVIATVFYRLSLPVTVPGTLGMRMVPATACQHMPQDGAESDEASHTLHGGLGRANRIHITILPAVGSGNQRK